MSDAYKQERLTFIRAIAALPWYDDSARLVFADWLDEHGEHEEAERQRKYVPACRWLKNFADKHDDFKTYLFQKEPLDPVNDSEVGLGRLIAFLKAHTEEAVGDEDEEGNVLREGEIVLSLDTPCFSDYSEELWAHFETVTGHKAPQGVYRTRRPNFRCTC